MLVLISGKKDDILAMTMKKFIFVVVWVITAFGLYAAEIELIIEGVNPGEGTLHASLYNMANGFSERKKSLAWYELNDAEGMISFVMSNIENGKYAIFVFQDFDGNGKLSRNLFGSPSEPFGVSMNRLGAFDRPVYSRAEFEIANRDNVQILIVLKDN